MNGASREPTKLFIDSVLLREAGALNINLSRAAEEGVRAAVLKAKAKKWRLLNSEAIESSNEYVEKHGLPLDKLRPF